MGEAIPMAGWTGGPVTRTRQPIIPEAATEPFRCRVVNFSPGAMTGLHTHPCEPMLIITSGTGLAATEHDAQEVTVGDIVPITAGEQHWHDAKQDTTMSHIMSVQKSHNNGKHRTSREPAHAAIRS